MNKSVWLHVGTNVSSVNLGLGSRAYFWFFVKLIKIIEMPVLGLLVLYCCFTCCVAVCWSTSVYQWLTYLLLPVNNGINISRKIPTITLYIHVCELHVPPMCTPTSALCEQSSIFWKLYESKLYLWVCWAVSSSNAPVIVMWSPQLLSVVLFFFSLLDSSVGEETAHAAVEEQLDRDEEKGRGILCNDGS